jgi:serine/threonine-protein kinase RIO1
VLTPTTSDQLRAVFEALLDTPFTFGLCHGDLSEKNVLLHPSGEVYLLDWGCAEAHIVPHFELFTILSNHVPEDSREFQAFLQGYGLNDYADLKPQIEMIKLLTFVDKLRWAIDRSPENIEAFAERARQQIAVAFL